MKPFTLNPVVIILGFFAVVFIQLLPFIVMMWLLYEALRFLHINRMSARTELKEQVAQLKRSVERWRTLK